MNERRLRQPGGSPENSYIYYWIVFAVISLETFAIFFNGAYFLEAMTLCVAGMWTILLASLLVNRADAGLMISRPAVIPVHLMLLFWLWTGASIFWSMAPDLGWNEFNRTGGYFAVLMLGIIAGRHRLPRNLAVGLFLAAAAAAAFYGLGVKLFPSHLKNTDELARISIPLGYTNAMGILTAMVIPFSIWFAVAAGIRWYLRLAAAAIAPVLMICLFFTVSRGAMIALAFGLAMYFLISPARLRSLGFLVLSLAPTVFVSWWGNGQDALMKDKIELGLRQEAAGPLRLFVLLAVVFVGAVYLLALFAGRKITVPKTVSRATGAVVLAAILITSVAGGYSFLSSKPSVSGWARDTYEEFTTAKTSKLGAARLLQVGSQGRWKLWEEALRNWDDHRVLGTGAQSFPLVHLQRQAFDAPFVKQPHGLPFRMLTELGAVGFAIGYLFIASALTVSLLLKCRLRDRWDKALAAAIATFAIIYLVHSGFDWDWNMFALTGAYFFFSGISIGWYACGADACATGTVERSAPGSGHSLLKQ